ncbi:MAG: hypothetical protein ACYCZN_03550 [Candidatus Dormibacteria bacterium]
MLRPPSLPGQGQVGRALHSRLAWSLALILRLARLGPAADALGQTASWSTESAGFSDDTELFDGTVSSDRRQRPIGQTRVSRAGHPDDIAAAVEHLASPELPCHCRALAAVA